MPTSLVLTVLGEDRPGLVESLASIIAAHDGNIGGHRILDRFEQRGEFFDCIDAVFIELQNHVAGLDANVGRR